VTVASHPPIYTATASNATSAVVHGIYAPPGATLWVITTSTALGGAYNNGVTNIQLVDGGPWYTTYPLAPNYLLNTNAPSPAGMMVWTTWIGQLGLSNATLTVSFGYSANARVDVTVWTGARDPLHAWLANSGQSDTTATPPSAGSIEPTEDGSAAIVAMWWNSSATPVTSPDPAQWTTLYTGAANGGTTAVVWRNVNAGTVTAPQWTFAAPVTSIAQVLGLRAPAKFATLVDDFSGTSIDSTLWTDGGTQGTGTLDIPVFGAVYSQTTYDLTDSALTLHVGAVDYESAGGDHEIYIRPNENTGPYVGWLFGTGSGDRSAFQQVWWRSQVDGVLVYNEVPYQPWVRFRQDAAGIFYFDNSPDGRVWTTAVTSTLPIDLSNAGFGMYGAMSIDSVNVPAPPPPPPPPIWSGPAVADLPAAPTQALVVGPWRTGVNYELAQASGRKITLNLTEPSTIEFQLTGYPDPLTGRFDATQIGEGVTDVLWRRNGVDMVLCRLAAADDRIDANTHTVSCRCVDYRGLLDRRLVYQDTSGPLASSGYKSFPDGTMLSDIVWTLISDTQGLPGGALGLTKGIWPVSTPIYSPGYQVPDGDTVWAAIKRIGAPGPVSIVASQHDNDTQLDVLMVNLPGFDIDIDPAKRVNLYYSMRGADNGVRLDFAAGYGGAIQQVNRTLDLVQDYANLVRVSGGNELTKNPIIIPAAGSPEEADLLRRPEGRWEKSEGNPNVLTPDTLLQFGATVYDQYARLQPVYDITLAPGVWDPALIGLGDIVHVSITSGRLQVNDKLRVTSIAIELDSSDRETVTLTVGRLRPNMLKFLSNSVRDLNRR